MYLYIKNIKIYSIILICPHHSTHHQQTKKTCCHGSRLPRSWGTRPGLHPPWFPRFTTVHLKEIPIIMMCKLMGINIMGTIYIIQLMRT